MDSQRTQAYKLNSRIDVLFPEWRGEHIEFDHVGDGPPPNKDELPPLEPRRFFAVARPPKWHDIDLKKLL